MEIEIKFGDTSNMLRLKPKDHYPWKQGKAARNGGRPEGGNLDGEGYAECPNCSKDSFFVVVIRKDVIIDAHPDAEKHGYCP